MTTAYYSQRPPLRRNSPVSLFNHSNGFAADAPMMQRIDIGDSSEDDLPQPMKFSALTRALLESDAPGQLSSPKQAQMEGDEELGVNNKQRSDTDTPSRAPLLKIVRKPSPHLTRTTVVGNESRNASPRILQIGRGPDSAKRTVGSVTSFSHRSTSRDTTPGSLYVTPGPHTRAVRVGRSRMDGNASGDEQTRSGSRPLTYASAQSAEPDDEDAEPRSALNRSGSAASGSDAATRHAQAILARSRNVPAVDTGVAPTQVRKRVNVGAGSFLRGAPVRRGFRRRDSDDHPSPNEEYESFAHVAVGNDPNIDDHKAEINKSTAESQPLSRASSRASVENSHAHHRQGSRPMSRKTSSESLSRKPSNDHLSRRIDSAQSSNHAVAGCISHKDSIESLRASAAAHHRQPLRRPSVSQGSYKAPPLRVQDAVSDQENMPPPTFKRNKDSDFKVLGHSRPGVLSAKLTAAETPVPVPQHEKSPRRALGALSANTPQRPAPPPPKMNPLDTATKPAGAATTRSKRGRVKITLKGKTFTQIGKLGKGGSSDVYSVMAENNKLLALKRVKLGDCDEAAVRGYKGEIDLLQKLDKVERVIRLYDWELDEAKGTLCLLMEPGEGDLNRVLSQVLGGPEPKLDTVFIRWWWREMLQCVSAVHAYDIVHSDLKPANFLVVGGRLKLIDFGIANAIETDHTMNVHRDTHIGTPNYMSPESITDTNAPMPGQTRDAAQGRVMKLGKPSDVWSLGCILYQMVYGRPPFAHIANQLSRVMAITNSRVVIDFPAAGLGGVPVPPELKGTLRRCLQRDPALRPTVDAMLSEADAWLYPEAAGRVHVGEELLAAIIGRVVEKCRKGEAPSAEQGVGEWAKGFLASVRKMVELEGVREGLEE